MVSRIILCFFSAVLCTLPAVAGDARMVELSRLIHREKTDSSRLSANKELQSLLKEYVTGHAAPEENLPDSMQSVSLLVAPDKSFRLLSWTVPAVDLSHYRYFGMVQRFDKKTGKVSLLELTDVSDTLAKPESSRLKDGAWFGCVGYDLLARKKSGKMYYTVLGWKGRDTRTTQKVIDVLAFSGNKVQFGYPLFKMGKTYKSRIVFEYTAAASMSLRYEEKKNMIVFDHLSVPAHFPQGEGNMKQFMGPDGSYDALEFKKGRWNLLPDIAIGTNWKPRKVEPVIPTPPDEK